METIVKYSNRKLYSKKASSYITEKDIIEMVQKNKKFIIIENKTQKNITGKVLASCILKLDVSSDKLTSFIKENYNDKII